MSICTSFLNANHQVNAISKLKNSKALPFSQVLTKEDLYRHMQNIKYRDHIFSPEVTLWAFLSQAIEDDKSQQAAVSRIVAAAIAHGERPPLLIHQHTAKLVVDYPSKIWQHWCARLRNK